MCADSFWLSHEIMLSEPDNLNDVTSAIEKIVTGIDDLTRSNSGNRLS